ncbi:hypothetical protein C5167_011538, partial [Papaver somniferum]
RDIFEHLSLVNNKEIDFDAFKATFPVSGINKFINSQGLVINRDASSKQTDKKEKGAMEAENSILKAEVNKGSGEKSALVNANQFFLNQEYLIIKYGDEQYPPAAIKTIFAGHDAAAAIESTAVPIKTE